MARYRQQTELVRGGLKRSPFSETSEGLFLTSGYTYPTAEAAEAAFKGENNRFIYSRYANPTVRMLEERLSLLEGAEDCRATSSGMAAVFAALMCQLKAGDRVVSSESVLIDGRDLSAWERELAKGAQAIFIESPSNPTLEIIDIPAVAGLAKKAGACFIVDNVFATPVLQKPLELGADVVVYSATKHIDGQGRCLGGAILGSRAFIEDKLFNFLKHTGPALSPFNAWVLLKALETLDLRVRQHCLNAQNLARFLLEQSGISQVLYPTLESHPQNDLVRAQMSGGASVITIELEGGKERAFRFLNALQIVDISNNLGDAKSLTTHPATTTHQRLSEEDRQELGITGGMVRISVGLEDVEDLKEDIAQALRA
jgi:O-succinylhomoserine sulfhydrylase